MREELVLHQVLGWMPKSAEVCPRKYQIALALESATRITSMENQNNKQQNTKHNLQWAKTQIAGAVESEWVAVLPLAQKLRAKLIF